jgi:mannosyl-oligosaccharide alpha-1,2-mannosidase
MGSLQLEFNSLSRHTGNPEYRQRAHRVFEMLDAANPTGGLYPLLWNIHSGRVAEHQRQIISTGASADSFYEYVLKCWIQLGRPANSSLRTLYDEALSGIFSLLRRSTPSGNLFVPRIEANQIVNQFEHLSCFLPGMIALGAAGPTRGRELRVAGELMQTCFDMYACMRSRLAPETVEFRPGQDFVVTDARYQLRPETLESLFVLYRLTGNVTYRHWGWRIFLAIKEHCRTECGFSGIRNVFSGEMPLIHDDVMQGYFFSETLKYLFLLFSDEALLPLDQYIFNTEAHPLRIFPTT